MAHNKPPHFTKILIHETLKDKKLKLPKMFVRRFGDEIAGLGKLKVADGRIWEVEIWKNGRDIWFKEGWNKIVKFYSLGYGSLLFFKYVKDSAFEVVICDLSNSEIEYPCEDNGEESEPETETKDEVEEDMNEGSEGREVWDLLEEMEIYVSKSFKDVPVKKRKAALEAARMFKPRNPSFMVFMLPTFVSSGLMYIPAKFKKYLSGDLGSVQLQVSGGNEWTVGTSWTDNRTILYWGKFAKEQKLKKGDLCLFELIKTKKSQNDAVLLKVSVLTVP